jgi:hypothetical protein
MQKLIVRVAKLTDTKAALCFLGMIALTIVSCYAIVIFPNGPVKYDCRVLIGGWHPDVPVKAQEECRKLMSMSIK